MYLFLNLVTFLSLKAFYLHIFSQELHDYGGGIPNELVVMLERCVGLNARWPGLLPDAYVTYRFYDLPPHVSQTVQCTADPVFNDTTSYPLAVTTDVLHYLRYDMNMLEIQNILKRAFTCCDTVLGQINEYPKDLLNFSVLVKLVL